MAFLITNIIFLILAASISWWLSGYDTKLTGENIAQDRMRRGLRCGISLLLLEAGFWFMWQFWHYHDGASGVGYLVVTIPLATVWGGCISEMVARIFNWFIDPDDNREFDPKESQRDLDAIARLVKHGHKEAAIQLCNRLMESGDVSVLALEATLEHLGIPKSEFKRPNPLKEASELRRQGKFTEAEIILKAVLLKKPADVDAAMMLIRLYAQEMRCVDKAEEVLKALEQQPYVSRSHIDFARRSIPEWSQGKPALEEVESLPESIDEMLAKGHLGTAIEILEKKTHEQPEDFDLLLKFAEAYALYCGDMSRAEKIVRKIETNRAFSTEQILIAKTKLKEWREAKPQRR
jgi:tetratricopeptide (TPR) repeat protein